MKAALIVVGVGVGIYLLLEWQKQANIQARIDAGVRDIAAGNTRTANAALAQLNLTTPMFRTTRG